MPVDVKEASAEALSIFEVGRIIITLPFPDGHSLVVTFSKMPVDYNDRVACPQKQGKTIINSLRSLWRRITKMLLISEHLRS